MEGFSIVLGNVIMMTIYLVFGYILVKSKKAEPTHVKSLSAILVFSGTPCMIVNAFLSLDITKEYVLNMVLFFVASIVVQIVSFVILYLIFKKKFENAKIRIMSTGAILGNVGFFGMPIIESLFPNQPLAVCYVTMFMVSMNMLIFTVGVFTITADKKYMSIKQALTNPTSVGFYIALILVLTRIQLPAILGNGVQLVGKMTAPICMITLGMRLATMKLKDVFTEKYAYISALLKLIVFPLFAFLCVNFIPFFDDTFKITLMILSGTPAAVFILSLAELHEREREFSANLVLLSTLLSVVTLPLLILLVKLF